jgi:hypothetical protein
MTGISDFDGYARTVVTLEMDVENCCIGERDDLL